MQSSHQTPSIQYDGTPSGIYKIWITNFFVNILTLGIYSFWGKTDIRKYCIGALEYKGDRLEYTGTGEELFMSFLKALLWISVE